MRILIVKHGALGDVVRTAYFAGALRRKYGRALNLAWVTALSSLPLLRFNPAINDIWTDFSACAGTRFDHVFSLDDETDVIERVMKLDAEQVTGAILNATGARDYTDDSAPWFDMGLLSRHGRKRADQLKKINDRSHAQIFSEIFDVAYPEPQFWGGEQFRDCAKNLRGKSSGLIGINPSAGPRWPSKELPSEELRKLVAYLLSSDSGCSDKKIVLFGQGSDRRHNLDLINSLKDDRVVAPDTEDSVLHLSALISELDYLISSDTLALHLAIAQRRPFLAFFAPTSAVEIDDFGLGVKIRSTTSDYCSYRRDADNSTLTAERILKTITGHRPDLFGHSDTQGTLLKFNS